MDHLVSVRCASCGEDGADGARFCERCGAPLGAVATAPAVGGPAVAGPAVPAAVAAKVLTTDADSEGTPAPATACRACGGTIDADGYCTRCGEPAVRERDHWVERPAAHVGGVCDRGVRHVRNEDAMALHVDGPLSVAVVCDGVSSAPDSDLASLAAARAARDVLATGTPAGSVPVTGTGPARLSAWSALLADAAAAANQAILDTVGDLAGRADPPSCTFVAAVVDPPFVVAGWLGDSRVYWLPDAGTPHQLSVDDSAANELMAQGVSRARAESSPQAHAITRWLGPDAESTVPSTAPTRTHGPGWVLVCSDGLWNYCSEALDLAALVHATSLVVGTAPDELSAELVRWANAQGGRDNVTVALVRVEAAEALPFDTVAP